MMNSTACWIWSDLENPNPGNRWTWFRRHFVLSALPENGTLHFAADSNARLIVNGVTVLRKVTRYSEPNITANSINLLPYLQEGENELRVLHHNWGDITTFQRTGNRHAGLFVTSEFISSDPEWEYAVASEYLDHTDQIRGIAGGAFRIRYPVIMVAAPHAPESWSPVEVVPNGPWPAYPQSCECRRQREYREAPLSILNAGGVDPRPGGAPPSDAVLRDNALQLSSWLRSLKLAPNRALTRRAHSLTRGRGGATSEDLVLRCEANELYYITVDFGRPVHGYPFVEAAGSDVSICLGYGEIPVSLYTGRRHVLDSGWIDTEGVVGAGLADRLRLDEQMQIVEIPEERTARWLLLVICPNSAQEIRLRSVGMVRSQYRVRPSGSFKCGDERIERFVRLALIHAEVTMTDAYVDTPGREDGQWIEDLRPRALLSERWFGDHELRRLMLRTVAESQGSDGNFHPFPPSNYPFNSAPYDWSVQWVAALHDEYWWTGDIEIIRTHFDTLRRYWDGILRHLDRDGILRTSFVFGDIRVTASMNSYESSGIVTPWIIQRLEWSVELAKRIGEVDTAGEWSEAARRMRAGFRAAHVRESTNTEVPPLIYDILPSESATSVEDSSVQYTPARGHSQAGHTVAFEIGLFADPEATAILDYVFSEPDGVPPAGITRWNNPTYAYRILSALSKYGRSHRALRHLLERMAPYLPHDPRNPVPLTLQGHLGGPLPEYQIRREDRGLQPIVEEAVNDNGQEIFVNDAQPEDDTGSHGWAAVSLVWLHEQLLGVRLLEPGGEKLRIQPDSAGLPYVAGHTMSPKGPLWVSWEPAEYEMEITLPPSVAAEVVVPIGFEHTRWSVLFRPKSATVDSVDGEWKISGAGTYQFGLR